MLVVLIQIVMLPARCERACRFHVCTPCVEGSTNAAGDDASGADTACDITHQCLVNQFYDTANHRQACPAGTNKAVAVDSTGGNSTRDDVVCLRIILCK